MLSASPGRVLWKCVNSYPAIVSFRRRAIRRSTRATKDGRTDKQKKGEKLEFPADWESGRRQGESGDKEPPTIVFIAPLVIPAAGAG